MPGKKRERWREIGKGAVGEVEGEMIGQIKRGKSVSIITNFDAHNNASGSGG